MAFPEVPRVLYELNPLEQVSSQLRFPPILRIDVEPPAAFQEAIRDQFPLYRAESAAQVTMTPAQQSAPMPLGQGVFGAGQKHVFDAPDKLWQVTLTRDTLSLICRKYERWEAFRERLAAPLNALSAVYRPAFFNHVCLKYRDVIRKWQIGLPDAMPWSELIEPWAAGPYGEPNVSSDVECLFTRAVLVLPASAARLDASYGLATEHGSGRTVFMIDSHLYNENQTVPSNAPDILNALNRQARYFFRACIREPLHTALRPRNA